MTKKECLNALKDIISRGGNSNVPKILLLQIIWNMNQTAFTERKYRNNVY